MEDIAMELSKERGYNYNHIMDVMEKTFDYIIYQTKERDVYAINIPCLGVMYLNRMNTSRILRRYEKIMEKRPSEVLEKLIDFWAHRLGMMDWFRESNNFYSTRLCPHFKSPFTSKFTRGLPKHYKAATYRNKPAKEMDVYTAVEDLQNMSYNKDMEKKSTYLK